MALNDEWNNEVRSDEFQKLPEQDKEKRRVDFFERKIAPTLKPEEKPAHRSAWDKATASKVAQNSAPEQPGKEAAQPDAPAQPKESIAQQNSAPGRGRQPGLAQQSPMGDQQRPGDGAMEPKEKRDRPEIDGDSEDGSDFVRGFKNYGPQLKQMGGAIQTVGGVAAKKLGAEETGEEWIESGTESMDAARGEMEHKESDQFNEAWEDGFGTLATDWLPYQAGQGAANLAEMAATMLAGAAVGTATGGPVGGAGGAVTGGVAKKLVKDKVLDYAKGLAEEQGEDAARKYLKREVGKRVGATAGLAGAAGYHGAGEVGSGMIEELESKGEDVESLDLGRFAAAASGHAGAELLGDKIALRAITEPLEGPAKKGVLGFVKSVGGRMLATGAKESPVEVVQTALERWASEKDLSNKEALKEYTNAAAAAFGMSTVPGGIGGTYNYFANRQQAEQAATGEADPRGLVDNALDSAVAEQGEGAAAVQDPSVSPTARLGQARETARRMREKSPALAEAFMNHAGRQIMNRRPLVEEGQTFYDSLRPLERHKIDQEMRAQAESAIQETEQEEPVAQPEAQAAFRREDDSAPAPGRFFDEGFASGNPELVPDDSFSVGNVANLTRQSARRLARAQETGDKGAITRATTETRAALDALERVKAGQGAAAKQRLTEQYQSLAEQDAREQPSTDEMQAEAPQQGGAPIAPEVGAQARAGQAELQTRDVAADLPPTPGTDAGVAPQASGPETQAPPAEPGDIQPSQEVRGTPIDNEWRSFSPESGTRAIPRAEMPQIDAESRGALTNYLKARGVEGSEQVVPSASLKPSQAEFSEQRVQSAKEREGGDRAILVSSDGHVIDGHHQWMAKRDQGEDVRTIQLDAPVDELVPLAREFPGAGQQASQPVGGETTIEQQPEDQAGAFAAPEAEAAPGAPAIEGGSALADSEAAYANVIDETEAQRQQRVALEQAESKPDQETAPEQPSSGAPAEGGPPGRTVEAEPGSVTESETEGAPTPGAAFAMEAGDEASRAEPAEGQRQEAPESVEGRQSAAATAEEGGDATDDAMLSRQEPVASLSGSEIALEGRDPVAASRDYYRENLQGVTIQREEIGEVRFSGKGWNKMKNGLRADPLKLQLIPAIPNIIQEGRYDGRTETTGRTDDVVAFHYFDGYVDVAGDRVQAGVTVGEDARGNLFYNINHNADRLWGKREGAKVIPGSARGKAPSAGTDESGSNFSIESDSPSVNISILDRPAALDNNPATRRNRAPVSEAQAREVIDRVSGDWLGNNRPSLVASFDDLPASIKRQAREQNAEGKIKGAFQGGRLYVVRDKHTTARDLEETVFHEAYGHLGTSKMFGDEMTRELNKLFMGIGGNRGLNELAQRHGTNMTPYAQAAGKRVTDGKWDQETRNRVMMDELLAHLAEDSRPGIRRRAREIIGAIKQFLRRHGFNVLGRVSDNELFALLRQAREAVQTDAKPGTGTTFVVDRETEAQFRDRPESDEAGGPQFRQEEHPFTLTGENPSDTSRTGQRAQAILARNWNGDAEESVAAAVREAKAQGEAPDVVDWLQTNQGRIEDGDSQALFRRGEEGREYTDAQRAALEKGGFGKQFRRVPIKERFAQLKERFNTKLRQKAVDQYASIRSILQDERSWMMAQLTSSAPGAVEAIIEHGRPKMQDGVVTIDTETKGFKDVVEPLAEELDDWLAWMAGHRADRLKAEDRENLFEGADIEALKSLSEGQMTDGRNREEVYQEVRREFEALNNAVTEVAVDTGLVSREEAATWAEQGFYVPFYRSLEEGESRGPRALGGLAKQTAYKKLKGGTAQLNDLSTNILQNWNHLVSASLKNQAATRALETAVEMGVAEQVPKAAKGKDAIYIRRDGQEEWYDLADDQDGQLVLESLMALNWEGMNNLSMRSMAAFKRALTRGVTASPEFRIANAIRDTLQAAAVAAMNMNPFTNVRQGWKATAKDSETMVQMLAGGAAFGTSGYIDGSSPEAIQRLLGKGVKRDTILDTRGRMVKAFQAYERFGARMENVNRAANYQQSLEGGKDLLTATFEARDHLDFTRTGSSSAVRVLARVVPFANARLQGMDKLARSATDPRQRAQFATVTGLYSLASVGLYLAMKDDEDYKEAEQWERDSYLMFKLPGSDTLYRIPKPFEVGAIGTMAERMVEQLVDDDATPELFAERLSHAIFETFSMNPTPQMFAPLIEIYANKSFFTGRDIESLSMQRLSPERRRWFGTSETAETASETMADFLPEGATLSPVQVEHLVRGYFGWLGETVLGGTDMLIARPISDAPTRPARHITEYPVVNRFARSGVPHGTKYTQMFYDRMREMNQAYADIRDAQKLRELEEAREILKSSRDKLQYRKAVNRANRHLNDLRKRMNAIRISDRYTRKQKRESVDNIQNRINEIQQLVVERTDDAFR